METCFIAMPISTPDAMVEQYDNDEDHFVHVLEHLFVPAIENVGLDPISPLTVGSSVVHAEIIRQIQDAHLVLCDMSTLNANVFFELGIRTALDLPVCLTLDTLTGNPPFDLNLVNHHRYNPSLVPWVLKNEIPRLAGHLEATLKGGEHNAMWSIVALKKIAEAKIDPSDPVAARLELLENQMRALTDPGPGGMHSSSEFVSPKELGGKRILWVDDRPENNFSERSQLERLGASVTIARSTDEAVEALARREKFDLILSDVSRQEEGRKRPSAGFDFLRSLREELEIYTPVIFYTGNAAVTAKNAVALKYRAPVAVTRDRLFELIARETAVSSEHPTR